jgi:dUTP pyrophosphatase
MSDIEEDLSLADMDNDLDFEDDDSLSDDEEDLEARESVLASSAKRTLNPKYATQDNLEELRKVIDKLHSKLLLLEAKKEDITMLWVYPTPGATMPTRAHDTDAGWDVYANADFILMHEAKPTVVTTGIYLQIPKGWEVQVRPRSGLAIKEGITVVNSPGTLDALYTGEIKVGLTNTTSEAYEVKAGSRIAQLVFKRLPAVELINCTAGEEKIFDSLEEFQAHQNSSRGENGLGSSGV